MGKITVIQSDITTLPCEAIVNAANQSLLGGGGVDGAVHAAAGSELLVACRKLNGCQTGEANITPGFKLKAKWIIHTVGPVWQGGDQNEATVLQSCYANSLSLAKTKGIKVIAFPAISTGIYAYPKTEAAMIALKEIKRMAHEFNEIVVCLYSKEDEEIYLEQI